MANTLSDKQQQLYQQMMKNARKQHLQQMAVYHQKRQSTTTQPQLAPTGSIYDDLPIDFEDVDIITDRDDMDLASLDSACRDGFLANVEAMVSNRNPPRTRFFLHQGLVIALTAGHTDITHYLLSVGAPILRETPTTVLSAPVDKQIPLFQLLLDRGWSVNTPGFYGAVLLPRVTENLTLLQWFLKSGADPNLGKQHDVRDRYGGSDHDSCAALERAAGQGNVEAVRLLLRAGAEIRYGIPLHFAAGSLPPGSNPLNGRVTPSAEFDRSRIPVMATLVEHGADVNQAEESRHMVPRYAIMKAVMAGAVERVRWLLEHGADPELKEPYGSAAFFAAKMSSEEMKQVIDEALRVRKGNILSAAT
ncbi:MAG: hypothetical protein Q9202_004346 [Teloschistes flavicans]